MSDGPGLQWTQTFKSLGLIEAITCQIVRGANSEMDPTVARLRTSDQRAAMNEANSLRMSQERVDMTADEQAAIVTNSTSHTMLPTVCRRQRGVAPWGVAP